MIRNLILLIISVILMFFFMIIALFRLLFVSEKSEYLKTIAVTMSQVGAAILYRTEDWTTSSMAYWHCKQGKKVDCIFMRAINILSLDNKHCETSYKNESRELKRV